MVCSAKNNYSYNYKYIEDDDKKNLVYGHKLSSVGPAKVSGNNIAYEPSNIDLAMKLHYLRVVYFLDSQAIEGITMVKIKESIFSWLNYYYEACGRFRRSETTGRPYIKCNDCGVRFVEAKSPKTIGEWLQMEDTSPQRLLVPHNVLGPELTFSPPLFLQITFFKCGGISLGLSWAHVLGDAFSLLNCMNLLGQFLRGNPPTYPPTIKNAPSNFPKPTKQDNSGPLSPKQVDPVGDHWTKPTPCEMDNFSFHVNPTQLAQLQAKVSGGDLNASPIQPFQSLCAVIWQAIARIKIGPEPNMVTVIKKDTSGPREDDKALRNNQVVSSVKADLSVAKAHLYELAILIRDWAKDERAQIGEMVDRDPSGSDVIVYGSKLTFVDLEEAPFYGFELTGLSPRLVNCFVDDIGEEGVVLVLPSPKNDNNYENNGRFGSDGRVVTLILPKTYMVELKEELKKQLDFIA